MTVQIFHDDYFRFMVNPAAKKIRDEALVLNRRVVPFSSFALRMVVRDPLTSRKGPFTISSIGVSRRIHETGRIRAVQVIVFGGKKGKFARSGSPKLVTTELKSIEVGVPFRDGVCLNSFFIS